MTAEEIIKQKRKAYERDYHREYYQKQKELNSPDVMVRAIARVKKLSKEIGQLNTNRVVEVLEEIKKESEVRLP